MSRSLLLIGDAGVATGFALLNHAYLAAAERAGWQVAALGLNYSGDPHGYSYPIYPCLSPGLKGDVWGLSRTKEIVEKLRPDVVVVTNDPWNVPQYAKRIGNTPTVASVAVDGMNCRGTDLNGLALAIFWTEFGQREAKRGGFSGESTVIPLGVDLDVFRPPESARQARREIGLPIALDDAFIVGVVGRNQPRKRLDLTMMYFSEWIRSRKIQDTFLYLHVGPTGDAGYDLEQLARYLRISNRVIVSEPEIGQGVSSRGLARTYGCFDAMLSTTQGEGWGLCHMEGMACGVPQIVPEWAALGEWTEDAAIRVPCTTLACTPNGINAVGGVTDRVIAIDALQALYSDRALRARLAKRGLEVVRQPQYRWEAIGARFVEALENVLRPTLEVAVCSR